MRTYYSILHVSICAFVRLTKLGNDFSLIYSISLVPFTLVIHIISLETHGHNFELPLTLPYRFIHSVSMDDTQEFSPFVLELQIFVVLNFSILIVLLLSASFQETK